MSYSPRISQRRQQGYASDQPLNEFLDKLKTRHVVNRNIDVMALKAKKLQMKPLTENVPYLEPIHLQHGVLSVAGDRYLLRAEF